MGRGAMIRAGVLAVSCAVGAPVAFGQAPKAAKPADAPPPKATVPADPAKIERVLELWEESSSLLTTLDVDIFRHDSIVDWDEHTYLEGRALLKRPNLAHIEYRKIQLDEQKKPVKDPKTNAWVSSHKEREVYTGEQVRRYVFGTKEVVVQTLYGSLATRVIDGTPQSMFFDIKADEIKKRFQTAIISEDDRSYGMSLVPRSGLGSSSFSKAFVLLDRERMLPTRVVFVSLDGKSRKDFQFSAIKPNAGIDEGMFEAKADPSWTERRFVADGLVRILRLW
jgi:outer membrane lipoprotein-sorting protein